MKKLIVFLMCINLMAVTKVGNGNDGEDLRNFKKVDGGILFETRNQAIELLEKLNTSNIDGLTTLIDEVKKSEIYLAKTNLTSEQIKKIGGYENKKQINARTFPRPHATTRFFPSSLMLSQKDLITLHIHEGLHRGLPQNIRENEVKVESIAEAITTPGAKFNDIKEVVTGVKSDGDEKYFAKSDKSYGDVSFKKYRPDVVKKSSLNNPSTIGLEQGFITGKKRGDLFGYTTLNSHLYPFGKGRHAIGVGLDVSFFEGKNNSFLGPLGASLRMLVFTMRGFDIEAFGEAKINTVSAQESVDAYLGRNLGKMGLTMKYAESNFYISNDLTYTFESQAKRIVGPTTLFENYGAIYGARVRAGTSLSKVDLGVFAELSISEGIDISDDVGFSQTGDTLRVVSVGPEFSYNFDNLTLSLRGRFKIDSTQDVELSSLGDVFGVGAGNGNISLGLKYKF